MSTINQMHDPHGSSGNVHNPSEFINHGDFLPDLPELSVTQIGQVSDSLEE